MKKEDINNMMILFVLGVIFTSIAAYSIYTGTIDIGSRHSGRALIIYRDVQPLYFWFFTGLSSLFGIACIKGGITEWLSRHDNNDKAGKEE